MNRERRIVPIIFGILILTGTSGIQFAPTSVQTADAVFTKKIIGYFPEWENVDVDRIDYSKLTHIIYFHIWPNSDGTLDTSAVHFDELNKIVTSAHEAEVKVMIAAGGWGVSRGFGPMAADDTARANFTSNVIQFLNEHNLDGIDIDWEPIDTETKKINQKELLHYMRTELDKLPDHKILTVAVNAERIDLFRESENDVDWVNIMAYDMNWRKGPHSTFEDSVAALERYAVEVGIAEDKLALGIPFYGRNDQAKAEKYEDLITMCNLTSSDNYCNGYFFNGVDLVKQKSEFILNSNYAGVMIWNLGQDTYDESTSLLNAINQIMNIPAPDPGPPIANPDSYSVLVTKILSEDAPGVLGNDIEPDGEPMTAHLIQDTSNGNLNLAYNGSFVYMPDPGFIGIDSFSYKAHDGNSTGNIANVTIQVNTPPSLIEETSSGFQDRNAVNSVTTDELLSGVPNNLYLTSISVNPNIDVESVTGMGLSWIPLSSQCGAMGGSQSEVWFAIGNETTSDGVITAQLASDAKSMVVSTSRISGINPQDPFGSIITGNNNPDGSCSDGSVSDNYDFQIDIKNQNSMLFGVIGASYEQNGYQHFPGPGFEEVFHWVTKFNDVGLSVVQKPDLPKAETSLNGAFSQLRDWHVIGIEIKPEGVGDETNVPPTSNAGGPYTNNTGLSVTFDGSGSFDLGGSIVSYDWDFGDSSLGSGTSPTHTYSSSGTYDISLKVTDNEGATDTSTATATVSSVEVTPLSIIGITPNNMTKGEIISVIVSGTGFQSGATVTFGGAGFAPTVETIPFVDSETISFNVTRDDKGPKRDYVYDVTVTNPDGSSDTLPGKFTVYN